MKSTLALIILALCCALTACKTTTERVVESPNQVDEYDQPVMDRSELPSDNFSARDVIGAINDAGGLTNLPLGIANNVLDDYMSRLSDMPAASMMVDDLQLVKQEINSGIIDRGEVGRALKRLGAQTRIIAKGDGPYELLGSALTSSGEQLVGDADMEKE